jgi:hypothetical protein
VVRGQLGARLVVERGRRPLSVLGTTQ